MEDMDNVEVLEVVKVTEEVENVYSQVEMTSPKKKRGKTDENSHERPKKSAYLLYYFDVHQVMQLGTPNLPQSEVNKRISESWRRLSVAEKSYYLERAKLEKEGIDTTSQSSSKHLPGFRKILPRANCFLVPNSASSNYQAVGSQSEVCIESIDFSAEGSLCSVALRVPKSKVAPVDLATEMEISEPPTVPSDTAEETVVPSYSVKTYTRRGRGRCLNPGCSFVYVTRHKPPTCPECGSHLGGKWIPAVKVELCIRCSSDVVVLVATVPQEILSGLKPSTLKQLGQTVPTTTTIQVKTHPSILKTQSDSDEVKFLHSLHPLLQDSSVSDLGLSTARGRGRCKNPACDYMYKNRHKPAVCPKCGTELTRKNTKPPKTLLDPHQDLSPAQRDVQRQSTLQLIRSTLQIPESDTELQETLSLIQELNNVKIVLVKNGEGSDAETETLLETGWPQFYESAATHCGLCSYHLLKGGRGTVAGQEDCWLLTETLMQTASLQLKVCPNLRCLALHSFADLHPGLFNVGNRLLVSLDLFLKIRANIKLGQTPSLAAQSVLTPEESSQVQELFLSGYWAFECLTVRDYNDMICGICGVAPKVEIAQRHRNDVLELKNVEFTWPECSVSDEVHVDDFWLTMEGEAIEQAAFPADIPITRVDASIIAPFAPPLMRSPTVINTEKDKLMPQIQQPAGDPSALVRLIHDGQLRLDRVEDHSEDELRTILDSCGVGLTPGSTKVCVCLGRKQVVCSSKYLVRGETARDHVDLLLSSRYWPPVYVCDCPRQVALCTDLQYPELATQMWGRNQGCFSDPFEKPEVSFVTCPELQDQPYTADLSLVAENQLVHPITKSSSCWLVYPPGAENNVNTKSIIFNNTAYYYLYNRLVDFLSSRDIVNQQINQVVKACQPGEVVIRDSLYRLGVAQINTDEDEEVKAVTDCRDYC
uniref:HMG box domain containing 3 n=1 Tax=Xiphophorus couchianus TaxID=32473 RepID=A0A3B5KVL0_9TELE